MVKVLINKTNEYIKDITIKGHANATSAESEYDIVCAGISAVAIGNINSLDIEKVNVEVKEGFISIKVKEFSKENEHTLNILITSLKTIEESYGKHISVKEEIL